jgi:phosphoenolpyruvate carboxykinase (ATP)
MQDLVLNPTFSSYLPPEADTHGKIYSNLPPADLIEQAILRKEGFLISTDALVVDT